MLAKKSRGIVVAILVVELIGAAFYVWQKSILLGWERMSATERDFLFAHSPDAAGIFSSLMTSSYGAMGFLLGIVISSVGISAVLYEPKQTGPMGTILLLGIILIPMIGLIAGAWVGPIN